MVKTDTKKERNNRQRNRKNKKKRTKIKRRKKTFTPVARKNAEHFTRKDGK